MKKFWEIIGIVSAVVGSVLAFSAKGWWLVVCVLMVVVPLGIAGVKDELNRKQQKKQEDVRN